MHKIAEKEFTLEDFSIDHIPNRIDSGVWINEDDFDGPLYPRDVLFDTVCMLNKCREKYIETKDKKYWWQMIQLLPSSYNQTRNIMMNYEVLANIYNSRKNHKLDEWVEFCNWIKALPYQELITGKDIAMYDSCKHRFTVESSACACCGEDNISNYKEEE
jgi:hypothetical protein